MIKRLPLKTNIFKYSFFLIFFIFLVACSTKKDTFLSRNSHALSTRDNILYNGQLAFDKGMKAIKNDARDNFWKLLPIEKMQILDDKDAQNKKKNPDFELAETKATKAIQKHSMNIDGQEKNYQMDEAYLMLGQARYYDQRFFPALEAFNYILYKSPSSDKIYQAKIWREKTNMRLGYDGLVIKNITKLMDENAATKKRTGNNKFQKQIIADANALLAASFLNIEEKDSAVVKLKIAEKYTRKSAERARYRFILGQLHQELGAKDSAIYYYRSVIKMRRRADRELMIHSYAQIAQMFDYTDGDYDAFVKRYNKLVDNRENRPFLDVIYYQMGLFYEKQDNQESAKEFYNASLRENPKDNYLVASDYRNLGNMYFKNTDYPKAAKYYDSTLVKLDKNTREYVQIEKIRKDLDEVIENEYVARHNDSILNVVAMSDSDRVLYFQQYIDELKKSDADKKIVEEKQKQKEINAQINMNGGDASGGANAAISKKASFFPSPGNKANDFYFYNPNTVAFGKAEFKKKWGNRTLEGNWRSPKTNRAVNMDSNDVIDETTDKTEEVIVEEYKTDFYLQKLPKTETETDEIVKKRNIAYYQLGVIYKEKFKEYELATQKLEQLLALNPEERLVLPTMYNLYKIYQITDNVKAEEMKTRILNQYPDSHYAQIISTGSLDSDSLSEIPEEVYNKWYKLYEEEQFVTVLNNVDELIIRYSGDEIVSKFELLKANVIGKLRGLEAYKVAMQYVADNYPISEEGKNAKEILKDQVPLLEKMDFRFEGSNNWKILYKVGQFEDKNTAEVEAKINKFIAKETIEKLWYTCEIYTEKEYLLVIHGITSEIYAKEVAGILNDKKDINLAVVISNENYRVVQIKKNLEEYLATPKEAPAAAQSKDAPVTAPELLTPNQGTPPETKKPITTPKP